MSEVGARRLSRRVPENDRRYAKNLGPGLLKTVKSWEFLIYLRMLYNFEVCLRYVML